MTSWRVRGRERRAARVSDGWRDRHERRRPHPRSGSSTWLCRGGLPPQQGAGTTRLPQHWGLPDPSAARLMSPYFLLLEAVLVGFLAGFALALAIAAPPSFTYAPGSIAKV
jgi:hypothetical protein